MTDSMKFGPEWIRTLSESGPLGLSPHPSSSSHSSSSGISPGSSGGGPLHHHGGHHHPPPSSQSHMGAASSGGRYTLAEHRYGREEMLALYSSTLSPPENLKSLTGLYVDKSQQPLALFSFTEDEIRIWNRGVNPDGLGRGSANKGAGEGSVRGRRESAGGREGRGRGRGGPPLGTYFPRPPASNNMYPGDVEQQSAEPNQPVQPFNRNRPPFDRQGDRSWSERNGGGDGGGRGRMGGDTNWRRHRGDSEDGNSGPASGTGDSIPPGNNPGWRPQAKWQNQGRNWRDEDSWTDRDPRMSNSHLPEWAMEKNEGGGSFDASGAFHGHDVEDELPVKRLNKNLHHEHKSKSDSGEAGDGGGGGSDGGSTDRMHEVGDKDMVGNSNSNSIAIAMSMVESERRREQEQSSPSFGLDEIKKQVEKRLKGDEEALELSEIKRQLELLERQQQQVTKHQGGGSNVDQPTQLKDAAGLQMQLSQAQVGGEVPVSPSQPGMPTSQQKVPPHQPQSQPLQLPSQPQSGPQPMLPSQQPSNIQQGQSGVLLGQGVQGGNALVMLGQQPVQMGSIQSSQPGQLPQQMSPIEVAQHQIHQPLAPPMGRQHQPPPPQQALLHDSHMEDHSINDNIATDLVAKLMEEEEKRDKQWYYKDPQGQVQGPFSCGEMAEWFQSGYFTLNLMVKRACDPSFSPLGELIKIWGCIPFLADQGAPGDRPSGDRHAGPMPAPAQTQPEKEPGAGGPPPPHQMNPQMQDAAMLHQLKMDQYRQHQLQQQLLLRQQQQQAAAMASRNQVKMSQSEWPDHLPQQESQQGGQQASLQLRALLAQMQAHQHLKQQQQQQSTKGKESSGGNSGSGSSGGPGCVMETLLSLHQQQLAQQQALHQALQAAQLAEAQGSSQGGASGGGAAASIRTLVSQMQQGKLRINSQPSNIDSVWNGGNSWNKWSHVNPKSFKTEQQVLEEQMRAEDERKREELRKQEEVARISEDEMKERKRDKQEERVHNERNKRESEELHRRRLEEEELRRKQEAARRAEVERQRKEEDKRKKEEDKRRKEEEKRKQVEERERLKLEHDRNKKESEEAKKHQDLMNKIQRDQWCPPQASNTSLLEIQRSEREQQVLRSLRDQEAVAAAAAAAAADKTNFRLKWTETTRSAPFLVESLADIQAQQYRQLMKVQEKEKAEREKKEAAAAAVAAAAAASQQVGGTWSQGLNWGALPQQPVWHTNQGGAASGFWDQLSSGGKPVGSCGPVVGPGKVVSKGGATGAAGTANTGVVQVQQQHQVSKESKSKAKREEMAVMQLFGSQSRQDEFTKWCQQTLANLPMTCPYDIPTFVSFLREIESGPDVLEYVRGYVGESKEATEFARQFLERRHSLVQSQGAGQQPSLAQVHVQPISPQSNEDFQQVKSKGKNKKKGRVSKMPVDPRILGFSSTASPDRINVGDREYPDDL